MTPITACNEFQWIEAARLGDREAYGLLVRKYQDRLFHGMVRTMGSADDAEDLVQDAFVQAYLKLGSFRGESAFFTWLYRIALNLLATRRRKKRRELSLEDLPGTAHGAADASDSPSESLLRKERCQQVQFALRRLSQDHRLVLALREFEGFDYGTIADLLDEKIGTVRSRIHRARRALRDEINRQHGWRTRDLN